MIDTHAHLYVKDFDNDRDAVIERAKAEGVRKVILPNIEGSTIGAMLELEKKHPGFCYAAIGLHPTHVKENYKEELALVEEELLRRKYIAIGEIGIDLYWDKTFEQEQIEAFQQQVEWALIYKLPIIIHLRNSHKEILKALQPFKNKGLRGVFHSFGGTLDEAQEILSFGGFYIGINGIVTFKNSGLGEVAAQIGLEHIVLETDAPYLTPVPYRGKRNESAYLKYIVEKLAVLYHVSEHEIIEQTTKNAQTLFQIKS